MRYQNATKENLPDTTVEAVKKCVAENKGLFMFGSTGTGKTYTMHALTKRGEQVENFVELLVDMRDAMQKGSYRDCLDQIVERDNLFIDDIGAEKTSDFVLEFLYLLINRRYENTKRTVLSTNLTLEEFSARYGDRVLSRIAEMCVFLELTGEDKRL